MDSGAALRTRLGASWGLAAGPRPLTNEGQLRVRRFTDAFALHEGKRLPQESRSYQGSTTKLCSFLLRLACPSLLELGKLNSRL